MHILNCYNFENLSGVFGCLNVMNLEKLGAFRGFNCKNFEIRV